MVEQEKPEFQRLAELPIPYKGVTCELFFELLSDRAAFVRKALKNLREENPALLRLIITWCLPSPAPESSLAWTLSYYEIFSRTARKSGKRIFEVSEELLQSYFAQYSREIAELQAQGDEVIKAYYEKREEDEREKTHKEMKISDELAEFWSTVLIYEVNQRISEDNPVKLKYILEPLYSLRSVLYEQQKANKFKQKFPQ